ncbi:hypothetical protein L1887_25502 [Cichorium endivia]|nr:hypothetical protein L1887_25502 [Cichorium endivia]
MTKLSLLFSAAGLLLLVATAEAATKTIFTTTTGKRIDMSCDQQMIEQQRLNHCVMYLDSGSGMGPAQGIMPSSTPEKELELCCMQLGNIDEPCRCEALNVMMNIQRWIHGMAQNLPEKCKFEPQMCQKYGS